MPAKTSSINLFVMVSKSPSKYFYRFAHFFMVNNKLYNKRFLKNSYKLYAAILLFTVHICRFILSTISITFPHVS